MSSLARYISITIVAVSSVAGAAPGWVGWPIGKTEKAIKYQLWEDDKMGQLYAGLNERIVAMQEVYGSNYIGNISCVHTGYIGPWAARIPFSITNQWGVFTRGAHSGRVNVTLDDVDQLVRKVAELYETGKWVVRQELDGTPVDGSLSTWYSTGADISGTVTNPPIESFGGALARLGVGWSYLKRYDPVHFTEGNPRFVTGGAGFVTVQPRVKRVWVIGEIDSAGNTNNPVDYWWGPVHNNRGYYQVDMNAMPDKPIIYWKSNRHKPSGMDVTIGGSTYYITETSGTRIQGTTGLVTSVTVPSDKATLDDKWYSITNMVPSRDPTNANDTIIVAYSNYTHWGTDPSADAISRSSPAPSFGFMYSNIFNECHILIDNLQAFIGPLGYWTNSDMYGGGEVSESNYVSETYYVEPTGSAWRHDWDHWRTDPGGHDVGWMITEPFFVWPSLYVSESETGDVGPIRTNNTAPYLRGSLSGRYDGEWSAAWASNSEAFWIDGVELYQFQWTGWVERVESRYVIACPSTTWHSVEFYCIAEPISTNENPYPPKWVWTGSETSDRKVLTDPIKVSDVDAQEYTLQSTGTYSDVVTPMSAVTVNYSYLTLDDGEGWGAYAGQDVPQEMGSLGQPAFVLNGFSFYLAPYQPSILYAHDPMPYERDVANDDGGWLAWKHSVTHEPFVGKCEWHHIQTTVSQNGRVTITQDGITSYPSNSVVRDLPPLILLNGDNGLKYMNR